MVNYSNKKRDVIISTRNILVGEDVEVDYRGYEVTVENFVRLLTGRLPANTPRYSLIKQGQTATSGANFLTNKERMRLTNKKYIDTKTRK